jgi:hypothetical protein
MVRRRSNGTMPASTRPVDAPGDAVPSVKASYMSRPEGDLTRQSPYSNLLGRSLLIVGIKTRFAAMPPVSKWRRA